MDLINKLNYDIKKKMQQHFLVMYHLIELISYIKAIKTLGCSNVW